MGILFATCTHIYDADMSQTVLFQEAHGPTDTKPKTCLESGTQEKFLVRVFRGGQPKALKSNPLPPS